MNRARETSWTLIEAAAAGSDRERQAFAEMYLPVVRAYLGARWRDHPAMSELEDAVQDVFLDCFREHGALSRVERAGPGRFRSFLYVVVRNVALRYEERRAKHAARHVRLERSADELASGEERLSRVFDRAWATALLARAGQRHAERAHREGGRVARRYELLRLRFRDGVPIREISRRWNVDAARLHHEYATAREEFKVCLREEVAFHHHGLPGEIDRECADLLALLQKGK